MERTMTAQPRHPIAASTDQRIAAAIAKVEMLCRPNPADPHHDPLQYHAILQRLRAAA
jgi:hypothetical protein